MQLKWSRRRASRHRETIGAVQADVATSHVDEIGAHGADVGIPQYTYGGTDNETGSGNDGITGIALFNLLAHALALETNLRPHGWIIAVVDAVETIDSHVLTFWDRAMDGIQNHTAWV